MFEGMQYMVSVYYFIYTFFLPVGLAGTVYFFCDLLTPEQAGFPAFELPSVK